MIDYFFTISNSGSRVFATNIEFTTGDTNAYSFNIAYNGIDTQGCILGIKAKRADGTVIIGAVSSNPNRIVINNSMYSVEGAVQFEIALYDGLGMAVTTAVIIANVRKGFGEEGVTGEDRYPVLTSLISSLAATQNMFSSFITEDNKIQPSILPQKRYCTVVKDGEQTLQDASIENWRGYRGDYNLWSEVDNGFKIPAGVNKVKVSANILGTGAYNIQIRQRVGVYETYNDDIIVSLVENINSGVFVQTPILNVKEGDIFYLFVYSYLAAITILGSHYESLPSWFSLEVIE